MSSRIYWNGMLTLLLLLAPSVVEGQLRVVMPVAGLDPNGYTGYPNSTYSTVWGGNYLGGGEGTGQHPGVDILVPSGTEVVGIMDGNVVVAEHAADNLATVVNEEFATTGFRTLDGFGGRVVIQHIFEGTTLFSVYAHLKRVDVSVGQMVYAGEKIGLSGGRNDCTQAAFFDNHCKEADAVVDLSLEDRWHGTSFGTVPGGGQHLHFQIDKDLGRIHPHSCYPGDAIPHLGLTECVVRHTINPIKFIQTHQGLTLKSLSAGFVHTCGVTTSGQAYCWGAGRFGDLGDGSDTSSETPVLVSGGHTWASVSAGAAHTCGVTTSDQAYCWGINQFGELGMGSRIGPELCGGFVPCSTVPVAVSVSGELAFKSIKSVSAGGQSCGITSGGDAYCWGPGALGNGSGRYPGEYSSTPVRVAGGHAWASISPWQSPSCGIATDGDAYCWGPTGGLGHPATDTCAYDRPCTLIPERVSGGLKFVSVSPQGYGTCGVTNSGALYCWGDNPMLVSTDPTLKAVSRAASHTCAVTTSGDAYCWGDNQGGKLGNGSTTRSETPVLVSGGHAWASVSAGTWHTCGITTSDAAYCWGANIYPGELGNPSTTELCLVAGRSVSCSTTPLRVSLPLP